MSGSIVEAPSLWAFPFLIIFYGSASGVAKGSCGVDLMCLPMEAMTETTGSPKWSHHNGVTRCTIAILKGSSA
jgi:hypothetical protein